MTIEIHKLGRIFARAYMLPLELGGETRGDVWGMLLRDPGEPWMLVFRVRTYVTRDPHDGQDHKTWMRAVFEGSDDEAVEQCDVFWKDYASDAHIPGCGLRPVAHKLTITDLRGLSSDAVCSVMLNQPHSHPVPTSRGGAA